MKRHSWAEHRSVERPLHPIPERGAFRLALGYANTYHVGMSSLGFQRTFALVGQQQGWVCERFFLDGKGPPLTVESGEPLSRFPCVAFSVSFEEDYVHVLQILERAGIPLRRRQRGPRDPLVVLGGSCASINPLTLAEFVDVFALGAAENVLPALLSALEAGGGRDSVAERLIEEPGFFLPGRHSVDHRRPGEKLRKLELSAAQMLKEGHLPTSAIVTPKTEFGDKFLIEMSRGCPEKCRYCWASFGMGKFRWHPRDFILAALEGAARVTDQVGFVATAVGDHPDLLSILEESVRKGFRVALSSLRIPAVSQEVIALLKASGARSVTLAPETGNDEARLRLGKPITNDQFLHKIAAIRDGGLRHLKLYFLVGLPEEDEEDVRSIARLVAESRKTLGKGGTIQLGVNVLAPKPFTPWQRLPMAPRGVVRSRLRILAREVRDLSGVTLGQVSYRRALWQTFLSRAGSEAAPALEELAAGHPLSTVLKTHQEVVTPWVAESLDGPLPWHFLRTG